MPSRQDHSWSTVKRVGAKLKGCFKIRVKIVRPTSKGTDRCDSLWVLGQERSLPVNGCEELKPAQGHVKIGSYFTYL